VLSVSADERVALRGVSNGYGGRSLSATRLFPCEYAVGSFCRPAPGRRTLTAQGHPRAIYQRAIERGNLLVAETTLRELGRVSLVEALQLTALIAVKDPRRHARVSARWLARYLEHRDEATIDEVAHVVGALVALGGVGHGAAYTALLDMAEGASSGRQARGVA
jgi:hypothetical protein